MQQVEYRHLPQEVLENAIKSGVELERRPAEHVYVYTATALTPLGDEDQTFERMLRGEVGIRRFDTQNYRTVFAGPVDVDLTQHYPPGELRNMSYASALSDILTRKLIKKAGIAGEDGKLREGISRDRFAICVGSGAGATLEFIDAYNQIHSVKDADGNPDLLKGSREVDGRIGRRAFPQDIAARPSISIGAQGEGTCSTEACATSLSNLVLLYRSIKAGYSDAGVGGGIEGVLGSHPSKFGYHPEVPTGVFGKMAATSDEAEDPRIASRPFSASRTGFILSDGGAMLLLGSERFGEQHHLTPLVEVLGADKGMDAHHPTDPLPSRVARIILRSLIDEKNKSLHRLKLYVGHFTGTKVGDDKEAQALELALGELAYSVPIVAPKYFLGHQLGGAGAVTALVAIMCMLRGKVPGMNIKDLDPRFARFQIPQNSQDMRIDIATAAAFGFGGLGSAMTFGRV